MYSPNSSSNPIYPPLPRDLERQLAIAAYIELAINQSRPAEQSNVLREGVAAVLSGKKADFLTGLQLVGEVPIVIAQYCPRNYDNYVGVAKR